MELDYRVAWALVGLALGLLGYGLYFRSIIRGQTKPHVFTWLTFTLIDATVFLAQIIRNAGPGSWALGLSVVENSLVVLFALRWGHARATLFDWICLLASLGGIALWWITNDPLWAVVVATVVNFLALAPTLRKAIAEPFRESVSIWIIDVLRFGISLIALASFTFTTALFPAAIVIGNTFLVIVIYLRRYKLRS